MTSVAETLLDITTAVAIACGLFTLFLMEFNLL
jgi:hypothetical protein